MPEGPEVSLMVYNLKERFHNKELSAILVHGGRYSRNPFPTGYDNFKKNLPSKIEKISNKGKFIYMKLRDNLYLCISLSLSGHIIYNRGKYSHLEFKTTDNKSFYINDLRNFARIYFYTEGELEERLSKIGPDILQDKIKFSYFRDKIIKKKNTKIGCAIIDQKIISGVGNYIRSDALYEAKISPYRLVKNLSEEELKRIFKSIKRITKMSYKEQLKSDDIRGYKFYVYGRRITDKGERVMRERLEKNRNIYWVPSVQK
jgi:DNA-formamidopyrimidine glycosylase